MATYFYEIKPQHFTQNIPTLYWGDTVTFKTIGVSAVICVGKKDVFGKRRYNIRKGEEKTLLVQRILAENPPPVEFKYVVHKENPKASCTDIDWAGLDFSLQGGDEGGGGEVGGKAPASPAPAPDAGA